jgi:hypothetical protein
LLGRLKEYPHLIVVDNLETVADVAELLPLLRQLSNPSRFVLTSRQRFEIESGIYHFSIPELGERDALQLVRQEAMWANLSHLATAADQELQPIYETVGGNPLALRLIVGQTHAHRLSAILDDLRAARGQKSSNLYTFIFRRAWDSLDEGARKVWLCLPLLQGPHATLEELSAITTLCERDVRTHLEILIQLNLVNCHGTLHNRYYSLHSLTRTFLQEQVAQWI